MPTRAFVFSSTWNDPDHRRLDSHGKVAWSWLMTNSERNNIGLSLVAPERFTFETGVPFEDFRTMADTMQRSLILGSPLQSYPATASHCQPLPVLLVNFIRSQCTGGQLKPGNPYFKGLCASISALPEAMRTALLERYSDHRSVVTQVLAVVNDLQPPPVATKPHVLNSNDMNSTLSPSYTPPDDVAIADFVKTWPGSRRERAAV